MSWSADLGNPFTLQFKDKLTDGAWLTVTNGLPGSNPLTLTDNAGTSSQRYFRLVAGSGSSAPTGFLQIPLLGNSDNFISLPFTRSGGRLATVASVSGSTITVSDAINWTSNQFVYSVGAQSNTYYVRLTSGAAEGRIFPITANGANTLSIGTNTVSPVTAGDLLMIEPYWTLGAAFSGGAGINV